MNATQRHEWLESRRAGIGSSDVAKIVGLSRFGTALDVYLDKVNPVAASTRPMEPRLEWGQRAEPMIAAAIMDHHGWSLAKPKTVTHKQHEFLLASPDRENNNGELIEIKTAERPDGWGEPETAEIPDYYWLQVQHQLEVVASHRPDVETCWVFVLIGQGDFRRYRIPRDPGYLDTVYDSLREFWTAVETRTPPEPDWSHRSTLDAVKRLCQPKAGKTVDLGDDVKSWTDEYERLGAEIKGLTETRDELKARMIHAMDAAELGHLSDGRSITLKTVQRKGYTVEPCEYLDMRIKKAKGAK